MIYRLVNLDQKETAAQRAYMQARQLASRRVTRKPRVHRDCPCSYCVYARRHDA